MDLLYFLFFVLFKSNYLLNDVNGLLKAEKIVGGSLARGVRFKYVVAIISYGQSYCTGSIISDWHIATAAHCFCDEETGEYKHILFNIALSVLDLRNPSSTTELIKVDLVIMPNYYQASASNTYFTKGDLAVVQVERRLGLHRYHLSLRNLRIPRVPFRNLNNSLMVAGYGWNQVEVIPVEQNGEIEFIQSGQTDGKLRFAYANLLSYSDCKDAIQDNIADGNMCARLQSISPNETVGICKGDSGGPLVRQDYLIGIAINGFIDCNEAVLPGIYIDVLYYSDFIYNILDGIRTADMRIIQLYEILPGEFRFHQT